MDEELPQPVIDAAISACSNLLPGRVIARSVRLRAAEANRFVVAIYLPTEKLKPTPYVLFEVDRESLVARKLTHDEGTPYQIKNYK